MVVAGAVTLTGTAGPALADRDHHRDKDNAFTQTNLVSDIPGLGGLTDTNLINPWGIAFSATSPLWTSNQGSNTSTLYRGTTRDNVQAVPLPPVGPLIVNASSPTGIVFNPTTDFVVTQGSVTAPATFIFNETTFDATGNPVSSAITGWTGASVAPARSGTVTKVTKNAAFYTGLTLVPASKKSGPLLLAADAINGTIDAFDKNFQATTPARGKFVDPTSNKTPLFPYNVQYLDGRVYVAYFEGPGLPGAAVSVFSSEGRFLKRLVTGGKLLAPWGMAIAPKKWGDFGGDLLVGNVDNGEINAYNPRSGNFRGTIKNAEGEPLVNFGLWGIAFGNGTIGTPNTLVFAAGIGNVPDRPEGFYEHGLVGLIEPVADNDDD